MWFSWMSWICSSHSSKRSWLTSWTSIQTTLTSTSFWGSCSLQRCSTMTKLAIPMNLQTSVIERWALTIAFWDPCLMYQFGRLGTFGFRSRMLSASRLSLLMKSSLTIHLMSLLISTLGIRGVKTFSSQMQMKLLSTQSHLKNSRTISRRTGSSTSKCWTQLQRIWRYARLDLLRLLSSSFHSAKKMSWLIQR